ncbi:MAG: hypothetical protein ACLQDV_25135 [Candidatus Binataceae bacterium]
MQPVGKEKQLALPARHQAAEPRARSLVFAVFSYRRYYLYGYTATGLEADKAFYDELSGDT